MKSVGIVGAGVFGLTAAFLLKRKGFAVTVYEADKKVGGKIDTFSKDGFIAELGPSSILESSDRIDELIKMLRLERDKIYASEAAKKRYIIKRLRPQAMPDSLFSFYSTQLFSGSAKRRLLKEPFIPPSDPNIVESIADFVRRRLGEEILDYAVNPFVAGVYAGDPEQLAVKYALPVLWEMEQEGGSLFKGALAGMKRKRNESTLKKRNKGIPKIFSFRDGMKSLINVLRDELAEDVKVSTKVTKFNRSAETWDVRTMEYAPILNFESNSHDILLFATPAYSWAGFDTDSIAFDTLYRLANVIYPSINVVSLGYCEDDLEFPFDGYGALAPEAEHCLALGVLFPSSIFPYRAPEGYHLLTAYFGGMRNRNYGEVPEKLAAEMAISEIDLLYIANKEPVFVKTNNVRFAIPQYALNYGEQLKIMDEIEKANPGLFIGGTIRGGISVGDAIKNAFNLVDRIVEYAKD